MKTILTRNTNHSFIKTTINIKGEAFSRIIEKGNVDYSNACMQFHKYNISLEIGNSVNY